MSPDASPPEPAFETPHESAWRALAEATLKGGAFEKRLVATTADGLRIEPLYTRASAAAAIAAAGPVGAAPFTRGAGRRDGGWAVAQIVDMADPAAANRQILADLEGGANGLVLVLDDGIRPGLVLRGASDLARVLDGVLLDLVSITLDGGAAPFEAARLLAGFLEERGLAGAGIAATPGLDPLGGALASGRLPARETLVSDLAEAYLRLEGTAGPLLFADGRRWHEAGATDVQELGFALASAVEGLRLMEAAGVPPDTAASRLAFTLALDADQFAGIAKCRAMRLLWSRVREVLALAPAAAEIRVSSSRRMATARDPWVNMLRVTVACFSGAAGGADEIALLPFSAAAGVPDAFARRIARNTHAILAEESGLARVDDPAGGSGYVESLTLALAGAAWEVFRGVEAAGGLAAAVAAGAPQAAVAAARTRLLADVARRRIPITGVSEFPDVAEAPIAVAAPPRPAQAAPPRADGTPVAPLPAIRLAEGFERLRDAADRAGGRPRVFLVPLGGAAAFTARATFAKNLFEAGGFAAPFAEGFAAPEDAAAAFAASGARIACIVSSDDVYQRLAAATARALAAAGADLVALAGQPGEQKDALEAAGVGLFVHVGIDVVATLEALHRRLGTLGAA